MSGQENKAGPDAILFNGGVFQPETLRERLVAVMRPWYGPKWQPLILTTPSLDLAVAWGAASYAWLRHTGGRRIGGGIARSYYVGVERNAASGLATVLCVVPRHMEEDKEIVLSEPELELTLGQPVLFPLYTSTVRDDKPGQMLAVAPEQLLQLPPLTTVLRGGKRSSGGPKQVPVTLAARTTAVGTLELYCVARDGGNRWRLEFNTREIVAAPDDLSGGETQESTPAGAIEVVPEQVVQTASDLVQGAFGPTGDPPPKELTKALESALEMGRSDWPTGLCRRLADVLVDVADGRTISPAHRTRWFNLLGFGLRPGFGDPLDRFRIDQLWKLFTAPKPGGQPPAPEGGADAWIMWRRVAGGLSGPQQQVLFDRARPLLLPGQGQRRRQTGGERAGRNVAGRRQLRAARPEGQDTTRRGACQTSSPSAGADVRVLVFDPHRSARAVIRSAQRRLASGNRRTVDRCVARVPTGPRKRDPGLGVLPGPAGPPDRTACIGYRRWPAESGPRGAQRIGDPACVAADGR